MSYLLFILFNGFLISVSPTSVHDSKTSNESPVIEQECSPQKSENSEEFYKIKGNNTTKTPEAAIPDKLSEQQPSDCSFTTAS